MELTMEEFKGKDFTWLHLSDIHFGQESKESSRIDQQIVCREIIKDVQNLVTEIGKPDFIFITGDIAFKADSKEYNSAEEWLGNLLKATGCTANQLYIVPGNHDVNRKTVAEDLVSKTIHDKFRDNHKELDEYFNESQSSLRSTVWGKLKAYENFIKDFTTNCLVNEANPFWFHEAECINIIGLNSCLLSFDSSDSSSNLYLGKHQLNQLINIMSDEKLTIILIHHPLNWLVDKVKISTQLKKYPHLLFTGHEHDQEIRVTSNFLQDGLIELAAGASAVSSSESGTHSYNWGQLNDKGIKYYPRSWQEKQQDFYADHGSYRDYMDKKGSVTISFDQLGNNLPKWYGSTPRNSSSKIIAPDSSYKTSKSTSNFNYTQTISQWMRKVMCYNQGESIQFSWFASMHHKSIRTSVDRTPYDFQKLEKSRCILLKFLSRHFDKHFTTNFDFLHDYFKFTRNSDSVPRICIKSNLLGDKWDPQKVVTLARDRDSETAGDGNFSDNSYTNNTGFKFVKKQGKPFLCNNIPKEIHDGNYINPRLVPELAEKYTPDSKKDQTIDDKWTKCWIRSDKTVEKNPKSAYKSTLIIPITLIGNELDDDFIESFQMNNSSEGLDKTILGYLCFDYMYTDFFLKRDEDIGYFIADLLSLYIVTALNYTNASKTYNKVSKFLTKSSETVSDLE